MFNKRLLFWQVVLKGNVKYIWFVWKGWFVCFGSSFYVLKVFGRLRDFDLAVFVFRRGFWHEGLSCYCQIITSAILLLRGRKLDTRVLLPPSVRSEDTPLQVQICLLLTWSLTLLVCLSLCVFSLRCPEWEKRNVNGFQSKRCCGVVPEKGKNMFVCFNMQEM